MIQHRHRTEGLALRMLLARLGAGTLDSLNAYNTLIAEVGECGYCWFVVADQLADMVVREVRAQIRDDPRATLDAYIDWLEQRLLDELDHADDDDAA